MSQALFVVQAAVEQVDGLDRLGASPQFRAADPINGEQCVLTR